MFDIGFGELLIIAVLGLLVLGPERLPVAIKSISLWVGRFKRSYRQIRSEIEHEIGADEIRRQLHNEEIMQSLQNSKKQFEDLAKDTEAGVNNLHDLTTDKAQVDDTPQPNNIDPQSKASASTQPADTTKTQNHDQV